MLRTVRLFHQDEDESRESIERYSRLTLAQLAADFCRYARHETRYTVLQCDLRRLLTRLAPLPRRDSRLAHPLRTAHAPTTEDICRRRSATTDDTHLFLSRLTRSTSDNGDASKLLRNGLLKLLMSSSSADSGISRSPASPRRNQPLGHTTFYESLEDVSETPRKPRSGTPPDSAIFKDQLSDASQVSFIMAESTPVAVQHQHQHGDMLSIDEVIALSQPNTPQRQRSDRPISCPPQQTSGSNNSSSQKSFRAASRVDESMHDYEDDILPNDSASMRYAPSLAVMGRSQFSSASGSASTSDQEQKLKTPTATHQTGPEPETQQSVGSDPESEARSEHAQLCSSKLSDLCRLAGGDEDQDLRLRVMTLLPQVKQIIGSESRKSSMSDADDPFVYRATPGGSEFGTALESLTGHRTASGRTSASRIAHDLSSPPVDSPGSRASPPRFDASTIYPPSPTATLRTTDNSRRAALLHALAAAKGGDFDTSDRLSSLSAAFASGKFGKDLSVPIAPQFNKTDTFASFKPTEDKSKNHGNPQFAWGAALTDGAPGLSPGNKDDLRLRGEETRLKAEIARLRTEESRLQTTESRMAVQLQEAENRVQTLRAELARTRADLSRARTRTAGKVSSLLWTRSEVTRLRTSRSAFDTVFE